MSTRQSSLLTAFSEASRGPVLQERSLSKFLFLSKLSEWLLEAPGLFLLGCRPALRTRLTGHWCPWREGRHARLSASAEVQVHASGSW